MAEIVGAVASVITLCQVVSVAVSRVIGLYRAPAEIKALRCGRAVMLTSQELLKLPQEEVHLFHGVVRAVEAATTVSIQPLLRSALSRAQIVVEDLNRLITVKLIGQGNGSGRARRRTLLRSRKHLMKLCDSLREARKALSEALSVDIL